ncbi:MAG: hypothetical protein K0Q63_2672, partial [Paenibacillus sp.]|nr:hypothetical protein [Paenibacillus sp.]
MKKPWKLVSTLCISTLLVSGLAACSGSNSPTGTNATNAPDAATDAPKESDAPSKEAPTLVWWLIGGQVPNNFDKAVEAMNAYTAEKIGVKVDIKVASWGEWDTKINTIVNTGEPFDIMFTNSGKYSKQVAMGAFA